MSMTKQDPYFDKIVNEDREPEPVQFFGIPLQLIRTEKTASGNTIEYYQTKKPF